jgi:ABC-type transporter lipoprotein component MlaA
MNNLFNGDPLVCNKSDIVLGKSASIKLNFLASRIFLLLIAFLLVTAIGCTHRIKHKDWSDYSGPGAEYFHKKEIDPPYFPDPLEPWNRGVSATNHVFIMGVIDPLARVYKFIVPGVVRKHLDMFANNLVYPRRLFANLFQGKFTEAWNETQRFGINTTVGVLGFFDPASSWWDVEASDEDFGQTFGKWGWEESNYFVMPVFGPSTVRDTLGFIPDTALNPATYLFPLGPVLTFNEQVDFIDFYKRFTSSNYDPYHLSHDFWMLTREEQVVDYKYKPEDTAQTQTLRSVFLNFKDPEFPNRLHTGSVFIESTGKKLPYTYLMQPESAPLLFIIPGLGGHRLGSSSLALAEMGYNHGFSVVIISNTMNFEFMERASSVALPGHALVDANDAHIALDAIYYDIEQSHSEMITSRALMGYSLGAFIIFYIAAQEDDPTNELIDFDRYVTLDAPVRLIHGMGKLDAFYNAPMAFPPQEREKRARAIIHKAIEFSKGKITSAEEDHSRWNLADLGEGEFKLNPELPFSNLEAEYLIGLTFRLTLQSIIYCSQNQYNMGILQTDRGWFRRGAAYEEIADYSYMEYFYGFLLPYYRDHIGIIKDEKQLIEMNNLRFIEKELRKNNKIRNFANTNDFLTNDADIKWLTDVLGKDNVKFFPTGGHLGGLYKPEVQKEVMKALIDLTQP